MYNELLALWYIQAWEKMGQPQKINLVEMGPGRGTLIADMMRVTMFSV